MNNQNLFPQCEECSKCKNLGELAQQVKVEKIVNAIDLEVEVAMHNNEPGADYLLEKRQKCYECYLSRIEQSRQPIKVYSNQKQGKEFLLEMGIDPQSFY